jgi:hypothetical protein
MSFDVLFIDHYHKRHYYLCSGCFVLVFRDYGMSTQIDKYTLWNTAEELDSPAVSALGVRSRELSNALNGQS